MKNFLKNYLTPDEQKILIFVMIFGFLGISLKFWGIKIHDINKSIDTLDVSTDYHIKVDLQSADIKTLTSVPGIGIKKATDIVKFRKENGFKSKSDLMKIKGIGKKTYKKIETYFVDFGYDKDEGGNEYLKPTQNTKLQEKIKKIDINTANYDELLSLKGIGPKKANDIMALRKKLGGKFKNIDELTKIKGIGKKTVEKLKKYIILGN